MQKAAKQVKEKEQQRRSKSKKREALESARSYVQESMQITADADDYFDDLESTAPARPGVHSARHSARRESARETADAAESMVSPDIPDDDDAGSDSADSDTGMGDPVFADEDYAEPEFEGLWDIDDGNRVVDIAAGRGSGRRSWAAMSASVTLTGAASLKNANAKQRDYSKLEKQMIADSLARQKDNITQEQIISGRRFEGVPFSANPEVVEFCDFEVGKVYRQKIVLTNVSYGANSFHLLPTPADYIDYEYTPSGGVSPGMTCELTVVFSPHTNEDADFAIDLLASTGAFSIPLKCSTKKCLAKQSSNVVDFGELIIGETLTKAVILTNKGFLGTGFSLTLRAPTDVEGGAAPVGSVPPSSRPASHAAASQPVFAIEYGRATVSKGLANIQGTLGNHETKEIMLRFNPKAVGEARAVFDLAYTDANTPNSTVEVVGICADSPVYLEQPDLDLKICKIGQTYVCPVVLKNRATNHTARVNFEIPKPARKYITIAPRVSSVPPQAQLKALLTFSPSDAMRGDCAEFAKEGNDRAFTIPVTIHVEGQAKPCVLNIMANITHTGITLSSEAFHFGDVSIYESAVAKLTLTNQSDLPQVFGFVGVPDVVTIQPGDGFGQLLPRESLTLDVVFSPQPLPDGQDDCKYVNLRDV